MAVTIGIVIIIIINEGNHKNGNSINIVTDLKN